MIQRCKSNTRNQKPDTRTNKNKSPDTVLICAFMNRHLGIKWILNLPTGRTLILTSMCNREYCTYCEQQFIKRVSCENALLPPMFLIAMRKNGTY